MYIYVSKQGQIHRYQGLGLENILLGEAIVPTAGNNCVHYAKGFISIFSPSTENQWGWYYYHPRSDF